MEGSADPEILLCDTSYLGIVRASGRRAYLTADWHEAVAERISRAALAISVVTVAEERAGEIKNNWGSNSVTEAGNRRRAFLWVPIDADILERWAELDAECKVTGTHGCDDNDLWIAATSIERGFRLVTCDRRQSELPGLVDPIYLHPGSAPAPSTE